MCLLFYCVYCSTVSNVSTVLLCLLFCCVYCLFIYCSTVSTVCCIYCVYCSTVSAVYCTYCVYCSTVSTIYCTYYVYCSTVSTVYCVYCVYCLLCLLYMLCLTYPICSYRHLHQTCQQSWTPVSCLLKLWLTYRQTTPLFTLRLTLLSFNCSSWTRWPSSTGSVMYCCTSSTKTFRCIATFTAMSQYGGGLWVSRKGNETATNETSSRYYFILLCDVVKCLRALTVANGSRKWMLRWYNTSICQLCRWRLINMSVCSILVLYLHCAHEKSIPSRTTSCLKGLPYTVY